MIEDSTRKLHGLIIGTIGANPKCENPTVVTIYSMHDRKDGQWIIGSTTQDQSLVARRLRLCADILEGKT